MSTRPHSYLKTRIRGSRLQNVVRILVLIELTQRLRQAYRFAYDKQAADRLLPQNPALVNQDAWERQHITSDACGHMAALAQQQANRALRQAHGNASRALGAFDLGFSRIYAGKPMDGISNAIDLYQNGPTGRTIGSYYQGETGFKVQYMDTGADMLQGSL